MALWSSLGLVFELGLEIDSKYVCMYGWMDGWMDGGMHVCTDLCPYAMYAM